MTVFPKKSLGQHFLVDENIARKIIGCLNSEIPLVLEIGAGKGILSKYLLENPAFDPWFVEIDRESVAYLQQRYPAMNDRLIETDFLSFDLRAFVEAQGHRGTEAQGHRGTGAQGHRGTEAPLPRKGGNKPPSGDLGVQSSIQSSSHPVIQILGNFPYNISSQILFRVLEYRDLIQEVTGMFQREVAQRLASPPGSKQYGILSVLLQAFYRIDYLFTVSETVFIPPPRVKSAMIKLVRNEVKKLDCDEKFWIVVVKTAFNQRRKTLRNSLRKLGPAGFSNWDDPIFNQRPEQLPVADFVRLARMLHPERIGKR
ncbi:MAG: 16S rRNA (adenine(1518)-N(6)/adenine(1519)-N(6))-dimethyltransferase [Bacteroidales bacterium]|nr:16S rRNA (adenine(1518)-N(6)/adenine(1519)-N(6))-dimethyltransferase [Bacteroidales bacterium]